MFTTLLLAPPPGFFDLPTALNPDDDDSPNKKLRINLYLEKVQVRIQVWYFITKIVLTYCEKKLGFRNMQEKLENIRIKYKNIL